MIICESTIIIFRFIINVTSKSPLIIESCLEDSVVLILSKDELMKEILFHDPPSTSRLGGDNLFIDYDTFSTGSSGQICLKNKF